MFRLSKKILSKTSLILFKLKPSSNSLSPWLIKSFKPSILRELSYWRFDIKGILEETYVTKLFFSPINVNAIQDSLRYYIFQSTGNEISRQSDEQLYIIMRSIALQFGNFVVPDPLKEVNRLNMMIIDRCVNNIVVELVEYNRYINDLSKLPKPLENPHYSNKNNFTYDISNLPE